MTTKPEFVYVTYIASKPEKVWNALIDAGTTKEYWCRHRNVSDWKAGSAWQHQDYEDPSRIDIAGSVVESAPPRRLVVTWAFPADAEVAEKRARVAYDIEPYLDAVRLRVTHDELEPGSDMLHGITQGWPMVLSSLKTLLETGQALPMTTRRWSGPPE